MSTTATSKPRAPKRSLPGTAQVSTKVSGRPGFYRSYSQELALFNTRPKQVAVGAIILLGLLGPFVLEDALLRTLAIAFVFAIGALGLNIVTGLAGQVSLGHAFFLGVGAYTAAATCRAPRRWPSASRRSTPAARAACSTPSRGSSTPRRSTSCSRCSSSRWSSSAVPAPWGAPSRVPCSCRSCRH